MKSLEEMREAWALTSAFCERAQARIYDSDVEVSELERIANHVDRCHYNLVQGGLSTIWFNQSEDPEGLISALRKVGADETADVLERFFNALAAIPSEAQATIHCWNDVLEWLDEKRISELDENIDPEESWGALVDYVVEHRDEAGPG